MRTKRREKTKGKIGVSYEKDSFNFIKVSPQKLAEIKNDIRRKATVRNKKDLILFIVILTSLSILATILFS